MESKTGPRIFVNGKDVTGARNIQLKHVMVRFDAYGHLHIDAPKYNVRVQPGTGSRAKNNVPAKTTLPALKASPLITKPVPKLRPKKVRIPPKDRYFLVGTGKDQTILGCTMEVVVDGKVVRSLNGLEAHLSIEITEFLNRGNQKLELRRRRPPGNKIDLSQINPKRLRDAFFAVELGAGGYDGPKARLTRSLGAMRCTDRSGGYKEQVLNVILE